MIIVQPLQQPVEKSHTDATPCIVGRDTNGADFTFIDLVLGDAEPDHYTVALDRQQETRTRAQPGNHLTPKPTIDARIVIREWH